MQYVAEEVTGNIQVPVAVFMSFIVALLAIIGGIITSFFNGSIVSRKVHEDRLGDKDAINAIQAGMIQTQTVVIEGYSELSAPLEKLLATLNNQSPGGGP